MLEQCKIQGYEIFLLKGRIFLQTDRIDSEPNHESNTPTNPNRSLTNRDDLTPTEPIQQPSIPLKSYLPSNQSRIHRTSRHRSISLLLPRVKLKEFPAFQHLCLFQLTEALPTPESRRFLEVKELLAAVPNFPTHQFLILNCYSLHQSRLAR